MTGRAVFWLASEGNADKLYANALLRVNKKARSRRRSQSLPSFAPVRAVSSLIGNDGVDGSSGETLFFGIDPMNAV